MNIPPITKELLAPASMGWPNFHASALHGWLELPNCERKLAPTNIISRAELTKDHQIYSTLCRITITIMSMSLRGTAALRCIDNSALTDDQFRG
jgi:hypothetical protein